MIMFALVRRISARYFSIILALSTVAVSFAARTAH